MSNLLILGYILGGLISIGVPAALAYVLILRERMDWAIVAFGALVFFAVEIVRLTALSEILRSFSESTPSPGTLIAILILLAGAGGLLQEIGRYLGYIFLIKDRKTWNNAVLFGLGHGGLDAVIVALSAFAGAVNVISINAFDPNRTSLSPAEIANVLQRKAALSQIPWYDPLVNGIEQALLIAIQICFSVVVLQAFVRGKIYLQWAVLGHAAFAAILAYLSAYTFRAAGPIFMAAVSVLAVYITLRFRPEVGSREPSLSSRS